MSNILVITQASTKVITVVNAADNGVSGTFLSFSTALATSKDAIENKLFSGLAAGKALVVRVDGSGNIIVLLADDPGLSGDFVAESATLSQITDAVADALYAGL
jgi:hypothetical protein